MLTASGNHAINERLQQQILSYDPEHKEHYYSQEIPLEIFLEFVDIYKHRPIKDNEGGIRAQGMFFLWYLLREINPAIVIESGVWRGASSWMIDKAAPNAQYIAIDPDLRHRVYTSPRAIYLTRDFAHLTLDTFKKGPIVAFFDDHQDAVQRVIESSKKGIKHLIFDDNYPPDSGDGKPHLTLATCFALAEHKEKADALKKLIKHYYILPQIVGKTAANLHWKKNLFTSIPTIWENLNEIDPKFRNQMVIFNNDSIYYRWMTYVELY